MTLQQFMLGAAPPVPTYDEKVLSYSPLAHFPLNEASGNLTDIANGYTAAVTGGAWFYELTGIGDGGFSMYANDNSSHYFTADAALTTAFDHIVGTYACWANYDQAGDYDSSVQFFMTAKYSSGPATFRFNKSSGIGSNFDFSYGTSGPQTISHDNAAELGWHHGAITWNDLASPYMQIYYDGLLKDERLLDISAADDYDELWIMGGGGVNFPVKADVSKISLWNTQLTAPDLLDLATL